MTRHDVDRDLLFSLLAFQMAYITREALIAAMAEWVIEQDRPLGEIVSERVGLDGATREAIDWIVSLHFPAREGDSSSGLYSLGSSDEFAPEFRRGLDDSDPQDSYNTVMPSWVGKRSPGEFPQARVAPSAGTRYRKGRMHAAGGMGEVFHAHDTELKRDVALKEIKEVFADQFDRCARFRHEAEQTGRLQHPGIVPIHDIGAGEDGRPFYIMKFIEGGSLQGAVAAFHSDGRLAGDAGERSRALQELLLRFLGVCEAIDYAHGQGVIHRDLKPENVMVGPHGETLVIDWGLAKQVGEAPVDGADASPASPSPYLESDESCQGSIKGTPAYMSPEQASGQVGLLGPASDVYGLGATLYSLLTNRAPVLDKNLFEILRKVQEGDFPPPREVSPWLDPALEAICLKAMALRPTDRYGSAGALAEDIKSWLAGQPVEAYPEPWTRRARRWVRRHRMRVVAASALVAVALTATISSVLISHARRLADSENARARSEALRADAEKAIGDKFRGVAREISDRTIGLAEKLKPLAVAQSETVAEVLRLAGSGYDVLIAEAGRSPSLLADRARILVAFADVKIDMGDEAGAADQASQAAAIYRDLLAAEPGAVAWRAGLARALDRQGLGLAYQGRLTEALAVAREALGLRSDLARESPGNAGYQADLADSHFLLASVRYEQGDQMTWAEQSRRALEIREGLHRLKPDDLTRLGQLANVIERMATIRYLEDEDPRAAMADYRRALDLYLRLAEADPKTARWHRGVARGMVAVGQMHQEFGEPDEARKLMESALALCRRFTQLDPNDTEWARQSFEARLYLSNLAHPGDRLGDLRSQIETLREFIPQVMKERERSPSYNKWTSILSATHQVLAKDLVQLANLKVDREANLAEARRELDLFRELHEAAAKDPTQFSTALGRATGARDDGELKAAVGDRPGYEAAGAQAEMFLLDFARAQAAREPDQVVWRRETARRLLALSASLSVRFKTSEAEAAAREALGIYERLSNQEPAAIAWLTGQSKALAGLASIHAIAKDFPAELADQRRLIELRQRLAALEPRRPGRLRDLAEAHDAIVSTLRTLGRFDEAEALFRKRLDTLQRLREIDPAEPWGEILPPRPTGVFNRDVTGQMNRDAIGNRRVLVELSERLVRIYGGASRISVAVEAYLDLIRGLDYETPAGIAEARRALGRARSCLEGLRRAGQLHPVQGALLAKLTEALSKLPAERPPVELDEIARAGLEDVDYGGLADRLIGEDRGGDLLTLFASEAQAAEEITWLTGRFEDLALEPRRVEALLAAALEREKEGPLAPAPRRRLAILARAIGDRAAARRLEPEVFTTPPNPMLVLLIHQRLSAANRHREAARAIRELAASARGPADLSNVHSLAISELSSGQFGNADRTVSRALELAPGDAFSLVLRGWLLNGRRQFPQAREVLQAVLAGPGAGNPVVRRFARNCLVGTCIEEGDPEGADEQLRALEAENPGDPAVAYLATYLDVERGGDLKAAESAVRKLLEANPESPPHRALLGWILSRGDRAAEGVALLERAGRSESYSFDPALFEYLGDAHRRLGHLAEARAAWRHALTIIPATAAPDDRRRRSVEGKLRSIDAPPGQR